MKILFVCTGNTCRSPMAEGMFKDIIKSRDDIECLSAGLATVGGTPAAQNAIEVCKEICVNISDHKSRPMQRIDSIDKIDLFVVMTKDHAQFLSGLGINNSKIYVLANGVLDPYGGDIYEYRKCRDAIRSGLDELYAYISSIEE